MKKIILILLIVLIFFTGYGIHIRSKMSELSSSIKERTNKIALYVNGLSHKKAFFKENLEKISGYYDKAKSNYENFMCKIFCSNETKRNIEASYARMESMLD